MAVYSKYSFRMQVLMAVLHRVQCLESVALSSPYDVGAEGYNVLHDSWDVQPYSDLYMTRKGWSQKVQDCESESSPCWMAG